MKHILTALMLGSLMVSSLCSCSDELADTPKRGTALMLSPSLDGVTQGGELTLTRFGAATQTDENVVTRLDVYIFNKSTGNLVQDYHLNSTSTMAGTNNLLENNWPDKYTQGTTYEVYVVANSPVTPPTITTRAQLLAWNITDLGIVDPETLLMSGKQEWTPNSLQDQYLNQVNLVRAASKLELTVVIGETLANAMKAENDNRLLQRPVYRLVNYNVKTLLPSSEVSPLDTERDLRIYDSWLYDGSLAETWDYPQAGDSYTITAYTYAFGWDASERLLYRPKILVSFGHKELNNNDQISYHYYLLPLISGTTGNNLINCNYIYKATATLNGYGSTEEVIETTDYNINYDVIPWGTGSDANLTAPEARFLSVMPDNPKIYGDEVVDQGQLKETVLHYSASHPVEIVNVQAYYINKKNAETPFVDANAGLDGANSNRHYSVTLNTANHTISVKSMVPTNRAAKYIKFTVKMGDDIRTVIVTHYPSFFVMNIDGWWSSYGAMNGSTYVPYVDSGTGNVTSRTWVTLRSHINSTGTKNTNYSNNAGFQAKMVDYSTTSTYWTHATYQISTSGTRGSLWGSSSTSSTLGNYHMYVFITREAQASTDPLGIPINQNDNLRSPAFMTASHLGNVSQELGYTWYNNFCTNYVEVSHDGKVYDGWRIPTEKELQLLINTQFDYPDVMDRMLPSNWYWSLAGNKVENPHGTATGTYASAVSVRCVRDLTVDDVRYVTGQMTEAEKDAYLQPYKNVY